MPLMLSQRQINLPFWISTKKENGPPAACAAQQPEQKQKANYRTASFSFFNARTLTLTVAGLAANH
jgi:hypothetical protein